MNRGRSRSKTSAHTESITSWGWRGTRNTKGSTSIVVRRARVPFVLEHGSQVLDRAHGERRAASAGGSSGERFRSQSMLEVCL